MRHALVAYSAIAIVALLVALGLGIDPLARPSGWGWPASLGMGLALGTATVAATPWLVRRYAWADELARRLRPAVHAASGATLVAAAVASGVGEELLFRGLALGALERWLGSTAGGVLLSSAIFGALHRVPSSSSPTGARAGWAWSLWAAVTGAALAMVFVLTGSLAGCVLAHVAINACNLRYLRDQVPPPLAHTQRRLGGLLGRA